MYLLIDWGNTRLKFLLVKELLEFANQRQSVEADTATSVKDLVAQLEQSDAKENIDKVLIASVRSEPDNRELAEALNQPGVALFIAKTSKYACGVECAYQNPQQLGIDRWLAMIAGYQKTNREAGQTIGIVDIGSAITLDVVDPEGRHLGGHILPGKKLLSESLLNTAKVSIDNSLPASSGFELGRSTVDCVNFGVEQMMLGYLISSMMASNREYGVSQWVITGGDSGYWLKFLENSEWFPQKLNIQHKLTLVFQGLAKLYLQQ